MLSLVVSMCLVLFSGLIVVVSSPVWMISVLVVYSLFVVIFLGLFKASLWYSYVLFLIVLGGMLVVFLYVCSLTSEVGFESPPIKGLLAWVVFMTSASVVCSFNEAGLLTPVEGLFKEKEAVQEVAGYLFMSSSAFTYVFVVSYLFLALVCVVNVMKGESGPLRHMK